MPIIIGEGREVALTSELTGTLYDVSDAAVTPPKGADSDRLLAALRASRDLFDGGATSTATAVVTITGTNDRASLHSHFRYLQPGRPAPCEL